MTDVTAPTAGTAVPIWTSRTGVALGILTALVVAGDILIWNHEPGVSLFVFFVALTAVLASALLLAGGLQALQTAAILIALPFSVVMLLMCWSTVLAFQRERAAYARAERRRFVADIGDHYGLEVEEPNERGISLPAFVRRAIPARRAHDD